MKTYRFLNSARGIVPFRTFAIRSVFAFWMLGVFVSLSSGADTRASIRGATRSSDGRPIPGAVILVHAEDGSSDQTYMSGRDGEFVAADVKPGLYRVFASKEGFLNSPATVQVVPRQTTRVEFALQSAQAPSESAILKAFEATQKRIESLEAELKKVKADANAALVQSSHAAPADPSAGAYTPSISAVVASLGKPLVGALPSSAAGKLTPVDEKNTVASNTPPLYIPMAVPEAAPVPQATPAPATPPAPTFPEALQAPAPGPAIDLDTPFAFARLHVAEWHFPQQGRGVGYEILYPGSPIRHPLHDGLQSTEGPHHGWGDREFPVR